MSDIRVPAVRFEDTTNHVILIECAPSRAVSWKKQLLDGRVDPGIAETLGRFLGKTHEGVADDPGLKEVFSHDAPFEQLRLDPYHRTVAERHLSVASLVHSELDRVRAVNDTLVHGGFSPKNVLIDHRLGSMTIWLLDFEVAHWGDPAFDTAFMLNHLLIKSVYLKAEQEAYLEAARRFWHAYSAQVDRDIEHETVRELAVLMLARVNGKSPVEYIADPDTKDVLRSTAKRTLRGETTTIAGFLDLLKEVTPK